MLASPSRMHSFSRWEVSLEDLEDLGQDADVVEEEEEQEELEEEV
jgi:hypothetical protein